MNKKGQAVMELIIILPVLFFMMIFSFQIFKSIYKALHTQEEARYELLSNIQNTANGASGMRGRELVTLPTSRIQTSGIPILSSEDQTAAGDIPIRIGICRTLECK